MLRARSGEEIEVDGRRFLIEAQKFSQGAANSEATNTLQDDGFERDVAIRLVRLRADSRGDGGSAVGKACRGMARFA